MNYEYHNPVLLKESVDALVTNPDGTYVDVTFGGGGHSKYILSKLSAKGRLISFDRDQDVLDRLPNDPRFTFVQHNFQFIKQLMVSLVTLEYPHTKLMSITEASHIALMALSI
jgi:16S rRNA (cytosine1402-N4)-methyltransferase